MTVSGEQNKAFFLTCQGGYQGSRRTGPGSPLFLSPHAPGYDLKRLKTPLNTRLLTPGFT